MRRAVIAGNWKMFKTVKEAVGLVSDLKKNLSPASDREFIVAPPFTALFSVAQEMRGSTLKLSAQDCFWEKEGAYTGEVAPPMLKDAGCSHVIIGHSERRQYFGETDETVNKKVKASLEAGLIPIMCIGETLEEREEEKTFSVVERQLKGGMKDLSILDSEGFIIAYEPVWAIGTGKTATPEQAEEVHSFIRKMLGKIYERNLSSGIRILYGGSVKSENIDALMAKPDIDGALVGGASLKADAFLRICKFIRTTYT
jgi:triosephosphate isomerase